jgi:hypothetical protein
MLLLSSEQNIPKKVVMEINGLTVKKVSDPLILAV